MGGYFNAWKFLLYRAIDDV